MRLKDIGCLKLYLVRRFLMNIHFIKEKIIMSPDRKSYYCLYTVFFCLTALAVFSWYIFSGKTLIWELDGWDQHYKSLIYYAKYLRQVISTLFREHRLVLTQWDPNIGEGSDILSTLHYYVIGEPVNLLAVFVPTAYMFYMYSFLIILRLYLAGISFSVLCFGTDRRNPYAILAGSLSYAFCYWALLNAARHPYFLSPMIFFPLIITGIEKILAHKGSWLLTIAVCLTAVSNFYFFYIIVIETVVYVTVRLLLKYGKKVTAYVRPLTRIFLASISGSLMAGLILLPVIYTFLIDSRLKVSRPWHLFYPLRYYSLLPSLLTTPLGEGYYWTCLAFAVPVYFAIIFLFVKTEKEKEDRLFKVLLTICFIILLIPGLGQFINGMSYMSNRWCWGLSLLGSYLLVSQWPRLIRLKKEEARRIFLVLAAYAALCLFFDESRKLATYYSIGLALCLLFLLTSLVSEIGQRQYILAAMVILSVVITSFWKNAYSSKTYQYSAEIKDIRQVVEESENNETEAIRYLLKDRDKQGDYIRYSGRDLTFNANIWKQLSSSNYFWSLSNTYVNNFKTDLHIPEAIPQKQSGYDDRADLLSLSSMEYFTSKEGDLLPVPYGFSLLDKINVQAGRSNRYIKNFSKKTGRAVSDRQEERIRQLSDESYYVYRNDYALPLGYVYDYYISQSAWEEMPALDRQQAMLDAVCLSQAPASCPEKTDLPQGISVSYESDQDDKDSVYFKKNKIITTNPDQQITLTFQGLNNSETYVELDKLSFSPTSEYDLYFGEGEADPDDLYNDLTWDLLESSEKTRIKKEHLLWIRPQMVDISFQAWPAPSDDKEKQKEAAKVVRQKTITYNTPDYNFYGGRDSFLVNMGYSEEPLTKLRLTLPERGIYSFDSLKIYCRPMNDFEEKITKLKDHTLENIRFASDSLQGDIQLDQLGILCVTVPYSQGWEAYVNGKKVPVLLANQHYLGLELTPGNHHIRFNYTRPLQKAGCFTSLAGLLLFVLIMVFENKKKTERRSGNQ